MIKTHLVKAYVIPISQYPAYPILTILDTKLNLLQTTQNKGIRFANNQTYPCSKNTKQLHEENNIRPLNTTVYERALNTKRNS